jgi:hypothetical protein
VAVTLSRSELMRHPACVLFRSSISTAVFEREQRLHERRSGPSAALLWRQFVGIVRFGLELSIRIEPMYVVVHSKSGQIYSFGLTPNQATKPFSTGRIWYDGPPLDIRRCSPALFRRLQAEERKRSFYSFCRINHEGIAVCRTGSTTASRHQKG